MAASRPLTMDIREWRCAGSAFARENASSSGRLAIGTTGIQWGTEPCPSRGVVELENGRRDPLRPFGSDGSLSRLDAGTEDAARIDIVWDAWNCLEIEGMIASRPGEGGTRFIRADRIMRVCP